MSLLTAEETAVVAQALEDLPAPVRLLFFTQTLECETCPQARQILDAVVPLSPALSLEPVNFLLDKDLVAAHRIDRVPAIVFESRGIGRLRMLGVPAGYEFMSVLEAIQLASTGESGLSVESKALLAELREPIDIQVFSTPT